MKRILIFISMLLCLSAVYAQKGKECGGGDNKPVTPKPPSPRIAGEASPVGRTAMDPNEIIGPEGFDSVRWVSVNDLLNYSILFENDAEIATAAAQMIDIRFNFPEKALMKGFGIGSYCFSNMTFAVDNYTNAYQQRINLRDSLGIYVDIIGGLDVTRQQGFWNFSTIDPETGYAPWQTDKGMLPINNSDHVGEGFVTFQLKPYSDMKTGDTISIQASILFDHNDTIPTNRWCNKIDAGSPTSKITAELHTTLPDVYNLKFTGKDDEGGSGIRHILLYLANNSGIYEEIDTCLVDSVLTFPVEHGKLYKLYSIAVDNTGNREPAKSEPDVILNFNTPPSDIILSDSIFQDDLAAGGYVGKLSSVDTDENKQFTYALAEGNGAIHNDQFQITDDKLQIKQSFKCAEDTTYNIRISTTDDNGMSFSKAFSLQMRHVLLKPKVDSLEVNICEGEICNFHGKDYDKAGFYTFTKSNDFMCDSIYVLKLTVLKRLEAPQITLEGTHTLVSSAAKGNQWFFEDGTIIEGATEQRFTPVNDGVYYVVVSNGSCYSEPSNLYQVKLTNNSELQLDLKKGWNWISSNLSETENKDAKQFLKPIEDITERLVGMEDELINDPDNGFIGGITTISPGKSYKILVTKNTCHTWNGKGEKPEHATVKLNKGWNWIGYVPIGSLRIEDALANLNPSENDVIKSANRFSIYSGTRWIGTLNQMNPGEGYMYYSGKTAEFNYPTTNVYAVMSKSTDTDHVTPWHFDSYCYPGNTTLIGRLFIDNNQVLEGTFTIGAFSGNECRGIGRNVGDLFFMTIHGVVSETQKISLKAYEFATGREYDITESISFMGQQEGTYSKPLELHANTTTNMEYVPSDRYIIYPRPIRSKLYVNGNTDQIKSIQVLSSDGKTIISQNGYNDQGIDVSFLIPGVYVVAIITSNGGVFYDKVIKANNL